MDFKGFPPPRCSHSTSYCLSLLVIKMNGVAGSSARFKVWCGSLVLCTLNVDENLPPTFLWAFLHLNPLLLSKIHKSLFSPLAAVASPKQEVDYKLTSGYPPPPLYLGPVLSEPVDRNDAHTLEPQAVQKQADSNTRTRNAVKRSGEGFDGVRAAVRASSSQVCAGISLHDLFAAPSACASLFNDVYLICGLHLKVIMAANFV